MENKIPENENENSNDVDIYSKNRILSIKTDNK